MPHLRESEWQDVVRALEAHLRLQVQAFVRPKEWAFDVTHAARLFDLDALVGTPRPSDTFRQVLAPVGPVVFLPEGPLTATARLYHLVHGVQHVASYWRHGAEGFGARLQTDPEFRTAFEVEAYEAMAEVRYWLSGLLPTHFEHGLTLAHGFVTPPTRIPASAVEALRVRLARSDFLTEVGRHVIIYLREYHPALCGCVVP